jgi:hypothetical protein
MNRRFGLALFLSPYGFAHSLDIWLDVLKTKQSSGILFPTG